MQRLNKRILALALILAWPMAANAQGGAGCIYNLADNALPDELVYLTGEIAAVDHAACTDANGRSTTGTHLLMMPKYGGKPAQLYLGPRRAVTNFTKGIAAGKTVSVMGYRTHQMPPDHFVVVEITVDKQNFELRDEHFRPIWSVAKSQ